MSYIKGKNVVVMIQKGVGYVPWMCAVSFELSTSVETKEIMTEGDGHWRKPKQQVLGYEFTITGATPYPLDDAGVFDTFNMIDHQIGFTNIEYKIYFEDDASNVLKMITGEAMVRESNLTAGAENVMDSSFTCEGFGAYELFNSDSACAATLGTLVLNGQTPFDVTFGYTGLSGSTTLRYSVDGSTPRTLLGQSASGTIFVFNGVGINDGPHTIEVWPVCENGDLGASLTVDYTKT